MDSNSSDDEDFEGFVISPEEKSSYKVWTRKRRAAGRLSDNNLSEDDEEEGDEDEDSQSDDEDEDGDGNEFAEGLCSQRLTSSWRGIQGDPKSCIIVQCVQFKKNV